MGTKYYDALVVGAGFGGLYQLYELLKLGLSVKLIDRASGVGGTWYWNHYPGAMSDTEAFVYRYSWDKEDLQQYPWPNRYVSQAEVVAYFEHIIERHSLKDHIQLNTELRAAEYDEAERVWRVDTSSGEVNVRYLVTALGPLSKQNWPDIPGLALFEGEMYHTSGFPRDYDFRNKRVGVVGCGSTGIQLITEIAKDVKTLTCFQRNPQFSVPANNGPITKEYRDRVNQSYDQIWEDAKGSFMGMGFEEGKRSALSVSSEERDRIYQDCWNTGNGLRFMFGTFNDIVTSVEANKTASDFINNKIRQIVKDPAKAEKLIPVQLYARRPLSDTGYYEQFNRDNVDIVDLKATPLTALTRNGLMTSDGKVHELDVLIMATGFEAVDGAYRRFSLKGRKGESLQDHWRTRSTAYLGTSVPGFPNLFLIGGPLGPFSNIPPGLESHVEFVTQIIAHAEEKRSGSVRGDRSIEMEATLEAEAEWIEQCDRLASSTLFWQTKQWFFGDNVEGKGRGTLFFMGGLGGFRTVLREVVEAGYKGYKRLPESLL